MFSYIEDCIYIIYFHLVLLFDNIYNWLYPNPYYNNSSDSIKSFDQLNKNDYIKFNTKDMNVLLCQYHKITQRSKYYCLLCKDTRCKYCQTYDYSTSRYNKTICYDAILLDRNLNETKHESILTDMDDIEYLTDDGAFVPLPYNDFKNLNNGEIVKTNDMLNTDTLNHDIRKYFKKYDLEPDPKTVFITIGYGNVYGYLKLNHKVNNYWLCDLYDQYDEYVDIKGQIMLFKTDNTYFETYTLK